MGELIEPAPDAFEHRVFEPGELIEWWHGIFFMGTETGRVEGYRVGEEASRRESYFPELYTVEEKPFVFSAAYGVHGSDNRWVEVRREDGAVRFVLDRATGRSWRLGGYLDVRDASADRLLWYVAGAAIVTGDDFAEVARLEGRLPPRGRLLDHPDAAGAGAWTVHRSSPASLGVWRPAAEDRLPVAHLSPDGRRLLFERFRERRNGAAHRGTPTWVRLTPNAVAVIGRPPQSTANCSNSSQPSRASRSATRRARTRRSGTSTPWAMIIRAGSR